MTSVLVVMGVWEREELGEEDLKASNSMYLVTFSHPKQARAKDGTPLKAPSEYTRREILDAMVHAVESTQGPRLAPLRLLLMACFREKHGNGKEHDHVPVLAQHCFRFNPIKQFLLHHFGLASHWSCSHDHYASGIAYGYLPTPTKPLLELDPTPELWAPPGKVHPLLAEAPPSDRQGVG